MYIYTHTLIHMCVTSTCASTCHVYVYVHEYMRMCMHTCTNSMLNLFFQTRGADAPIPVYDGDGGWTVVLASGSGCSIKGFSTFPESNIPNQVFQHVSRLV